MLIISSLVLVASFLARITTLAAPVSLNGATSLDVRALSWDNEALVNRADASPDKHGSPASKAPHEPPPNCGPSDRTPSPLLGLNVNENFCSSPGESHETTTPRHKPVPLPDSPQGMFA